MKKKVNSILIIAVLGLWGTVGYRFLKNFFFEDTTVPASTNMQASKFIVSARDTFMLKPLEHDPFFSNRVEGKVSTVPRVAAVRKRMSAVSSVQKPVVPWPKISYYGFIKSEKNDEVALIKIDNVLYKMHKKEIKSGITLKKLNKDSVCVIFQNESKFFSKN